MQGREAKRNAVLKCLHCLLYGKISDSIQTQVDHNLINNTKEKVKCLFPRFFFIVAVIVLNIHHLLSICYLSGALLFYETGISVPTYSSGN